MRRTLSNTCVLVMLATSAAEEDMGEQRSPTNAPARMAPPTRATSAFMAVAIVMQMTPTVAAAAYELPTSMDMPDVSRKLRSTRFRGLTSVADQQVIAGMVPAARQLAVRAPMSTKSVSTLPTDLRPLAAMRATSRAEKPRHRP